ncbi:MAG TPA: glycosyltransferase family 9 protein, partial [Spirochaetia bacterium]
RRASHAEGGTLVYHAGALGDFITALPGIAVWRKSHRGRAVLLGRPSYAELADPPFDEVHDAGSAVWAPLFAPGFTPDGAAAPLVRGIASGFTPDGVAAALCRGVSSALLFATASSPLPASLAALGVSEILRQDPFPPSPMPIVDYHLSLFDARAISHGERVPRIRALALARVAPGCVALHPGSGSPSKRWPRERFVELGRRLRESGRAVAWVTGPAEEDVAPPGMESWKDLALTDLAGRLAACALFVGNDSGVTHLAAAAGCTTIALFGATSSVTWAPRGRSVAVVDAPHARLTEISSAGIFRLCEGFLSR